MKYMHDLVEKVARQLMEGRSQWKAEEFDMGVLTYPKMPQEEDSLSVSAGAFSLHYLDLANKLESAERENVIRHYKKLAGISD